MKLLTATTQTQGQRPGDYHWCIDGELVMPPTLICARDARDPDGGCGCGRGWAGLNSHRATTTAAVSDIDFTLADYTEAIQSSLDQQGWHQHDGRDIAERLAGTAAEYPVGTVVGHRLGELYVRTTPVNLPGDGDGAQ